MQNFDLIANSPVYVRQILSQRYLELAKETIKEYIVESKPWQTLDKIEALPHVGESYNPYTDPGPKRNDTQWVKAMRSAYIIIWATT
jgi:hypothetical protein